MPVFELSPSELYSSCPRKKLSSDVECRRSPSNRSAAEKQNAVWIHCIWQPAFHEQGWSTPCRLCCLTGANSGQETCTQAC